MIGQTISHYKILEKLGEGGMGVVYKAQDTKLDRFVALKFLPQHLNASEQDKARFVIEAKAAAALNHPNVCSVIDIQDLDGQMFIVMEFVDGQNLREKRGSINLAKAVDIGTQIAEGLSAAHEKGIVHRDIKPENIMIRKDGIVQIMDFGLAKLSASRASRLTKEGSSVGTAGYMSPEQVQGQETDHRSDIFSLGVLLYELFSGEHPFKGVHETALMYEIVNVDPAPMSSIKPEIEPELDRIVLECLQKEPDERYNSVKDIAKDLKRFKRESSRSRVSRITAVRDIQKSMTNTQVAASQISVSETSPVKKERSILLISAVIFFILTTAALAFMYLGRPAPEVTAVRFSVSGPVKGSFEGEAPVISPDGKKIALVARDSSGKSMIWIRNLSMLQAEPLTGTLDATYPFWSPDNRFIGFFQDGKLKKIEVQGGPAQTIADASDGRGGTWSKAGVIVFAPGYASGLFQVSESGGKTVELTSLDTSRKEDTHRWPCFLPDGKRFVFLRRSSLEEKTGLYLRSLESNEEKMLSIERTNAVYTSMGYLLFIRENSLMAQGFNEDKGSFEGDAFPIAEDVGSEPSRNLGYFSASANGNLVFSSGGAAGGARQIMWIDRSGKRLEKVGEPGLIYDMALSPDEKRVVFRRIDPQTRNHDLWILDILRRTESRFTFKPTLDDDPVWSSDGSKIIFDSNPDGTPNPHEKIATGAGSEQLLWKASQVAQPSDWSTDGRFVIVNFADPKTKSDLWILPLFGDKKPFPFLQSEADETVGRFSPDGRWIAYESDESGKYEVYVQAFPASQGKWQVSVRGGGAPQWSKDGKEIFYLAPDKKLMAVDVKSSGSSFEQGIPKPLFDTYVDNYSAPNRYAVSRDSKRFLVNNSAEGDNSKPITVVLNWTSDIKTK